MSDGAVLKLKRPLKWGDETITELVFQEPKGKHLRKLPAEPNTGDILNLGAQLCGQPTALIDELHAGDAGEVCKVVGKLLSDGLETGKSS